MKNVYRTDDPNTIAYLKNALESYGIECVVKNDYLPFPLSAAMDCGPELYVMDDSRYEQAHEIIGQALRAENPLLESWKCPGCEEMIESHFTECWKCGASRPEG